MSHASNSIILQVATSTSDPSRQNPAVLLDGSTVLNATSNSVPVFVGRIQTFCVVASCPSSGTPVGTVKIQGCVDASAHGEDVPDVNLVNWFDMAFIDPTTGLWVTSQAISSATTCVFESTDCSVRYIRLVYTKTSGSCTLSAKAQIKGFGH